jgi:hypothetical protein
MSKILCFLLYLGEGFPPTTLIVGFSLSTGIKKMLLTYVLVGSPEKELMF